MSTNSEALLKQAGNVISTGLGLPEGSVEIGTSGYSEGKNTNIVFSIKGLDVLDQNNAEKQVLAFLDKFPAVKEVLQTVPDENLAVKELDKLRNLAESTGLNKKL